MLSSIKIGLLHNLNLKLFALIFGYAFWTILSQSHRTTTSIEVPICFYNKDETTTIQAPETITVELTGKRADLLGLDRENIGLHIDTISLASGPCALDVSERNLLLPNSISIVRSSPTNPVVVVTHTELKNSPNSDLPLQELA